MPANTSTIWYIQASYYTVAIICIMISVIFFDRNIAEVMHQLKGDHGDSLRGILTLLGKTPLLLEILAAIAILACLIKAWRIKYSTLAIHLVFTLLLASLVRVFAKYLFGRTWPETWVNDNPSWINNGIEAFHPFAEGMAYNSFPSGHTLFTFALAYVFWYQFPRYKFVWIAALIAVVIGQVGQNYHYLGDVLAGGTLGILIAQIVIAISSKIPFMVQDKLKSNSEK